jgi:hypothetical protein
MRTFQVLFVFAISALVFSGDSTAHGQLFGNGRFLKRMKDRFDPAPPKPAAKPKTPKNATPQKSSSKSLAPKPAASRSATRSGGPTPAGSNRKTPMVKPNASSKGRYEIGSSALDRQSPSPARQNYNRPVELNAGANVDVVKQSSKRSTLGFGMLIELKKEKLIVTKLDPKGNAAEEGIKRGDEITAVGGVDIESLSEFNDITKIMRDGDQIEVGYARRGKKEKSYVQLGDLPKQEESEVAPSKPNVAGVQLDPKGIEPIEPISNQQFGGMQSVLDSPKSSASDQTIRMQQLQIEEMRRKIRLLEQQGGSAPKTPSLTGPRN